MINVDYLAARVRRVNQLLEKYLPDANAEPQHLHAAMRYAVLNGGKRLRPLLVYAVGETLNAPLANLDAAACAIEFIHAYSLVHDDLPAIDNDDWRRGQLACHKKFDEATAILTGDALQALAFHTLLSAQSVLAAEQLLQMLQTLTEASGSLGMIGGQALELNADKQQATLSNLEFIHHLKTGVLIKAAIQLGALAANASLEQQTALQEYAGYLGLAFQIQDDIHDLKNDINAQQSLSYPVLAGVKTAHAKVEELYQLAINQLGLITDQATPLHCLTDYIIRINIL